MNSTGGKKNGRKIFTKIQVSKMKMKTIPRLILLGVTGTFLLRANNALVKKVRKTKLSLKDLLYSV